MPKDLRTWTWAWPPPTSTRSRMASAIRSGTRPRTRGRSGPDAARFERRLRRSPALALQAGEGRGLQPLLDVEQRLVLGLRGEARLERLLPLVRRSRLALGFEIG